MLWTLYGLLVLICQPLNPLTLLEWFNLSLPFCQQTTTALRKGQAGAPNEEYFERADEGGGGGGGGGNRSPLKLTRCSTNCCCC